MSNKLKNETKRPDNYLKNNSSGQPIMQTQTGNYNFVMMYDNYIVGASTGFYNFPATTVMLAGNYINTGGVPMQFPSGNSTKVYTIGNVLKFLVSSPGFNDNNLTSNSLSFNASVIFPP